MAWFARYALRRGRMVGGPWLWLGLALKLWQRSGAKKDTESIVMNEKLKPGEHYVITNVPYESRRQKRKKRRST